MATVTSVTTSPPDSLPSTVTAIISHPELDEVVSVTVDNSTGSATVHLSEALAYSPSPDATRGAVTVTLDGGGTISNAKLVNNGDGTSTLTATLN